jgi:protein gp37
MSEIEWTDETWDPIEGCSAKSGGCRNCWAAKTCHRLAGNPTGNLRETYGGLTRKTRDGRIIFNGTVRMLPDRLGQPLHWKKPRKVFVCSRSDLFHGAVPDEFIAAVFAVMAACPQHTFQILTKRPERMRTWVAWMEEALDDWGAVHTCFAASLYPPSVPDTIPVWPLPNVWLGVSVENDDVFDERVRHLFHTPAAVRWLSCEPLLGPLLFRWLPAWRRHDGSLTCLRHDAIGSVGDEGTNHLDGLRELDWIVVGSESGPRRRPTDIEWVREIRDQCVRAGVPFFLKQLHVNGKKVSVPEIDGRAWAEYPEVQP